MIPLSRPGPKTEPEATTTLEARAWLQARGVRSTPPVLEGMLAEALESLPARLQLASGEELTAPELAILTRGTLDAASRASSDDPLARGAAEYAALLQTALSVDAAAKRARVTPARIRQRLTSVPRTLVGLRLGNTWRVPLFQFDARKGLLPGIERVVAAIDPDVHLLAIQSWFLNEHLDLPADENEERKLSPRDWLRLGRAPELLVELASEL